MYFIFISLRGSERRRRGGERSFLRWPWYYVFSYSDIRSLSLCSIQLSTSPLEAWQIYFHSWLLFSHSDDVVGAEEISTAVTNMFAWKAYSFISGLNMKAALFCTLVMRLWESILCKNIDMFWNEHILSKVWLQSVRCDIAGVVLYARTDSSQDEA